MGLDKYQIRSLWGIIGRVYLDYEHDSIGVQEYLYNNIGKLNLLMGTYVDKKDIESILPNLIRKKEALRRDVEEPSLFIGINAPIHTWDIHENEDSVILYHEQLAVSSPLFASPFSSVTG